MDELVARQAVLAASWALRRTGLTWGTSPCKGGRGVQGFSRPVWEGLFLSKIPCGVGGWGAFPGRSSFFFFIMWPNIKTVWVYTLSLSVDSCAADNMSWFMLSSMPTYISQKGDTMEKIRPKFWNLASRKISWEWLPDWYEKSCQPCMKTTSSANDPKTKDICCFAMSVPSD